MRLVPCDYLRRSVPLVHLLIYFHRTPASPQTTQARHTQMVAAMQLPRRDRFQACRYSFTLKLPYSLGLQIAHTAVNSRRLAPGCGCTVCGLKVPPLVPLGRPGHREAEPFTPRMARLVTCPEMWYRYTSDTSN